MYYQGKNMLSSSSSSRMHIQSERHHPFLRGGNTNNSSGDSGLILSTDAKPRLKWTQDLHERFIEAVNQLGGADKATPKTIMKVMGIQGLTLYHLKSHLQKYRLSKNLNGQANNGLNKIGMMTMMEEKTHDVDEIQSESLSIGPQPNKNSPISEALHMQIEVQRRLHEQLEVQRHLQLKIEAQGKYLQSVLEKAQETLGRQNNLGAAGSIEAAKVQLSELVSKVSTEYPKSRILEPKELQNLWSTTTTTTYNPPDCSLESCLTTSEEKNPNNRFEGLRTYLGDSRSEQKENMELTWNPYLSTMVNDTTEQRNSNSSLGRLSIGVGLLQGHKGHYHQEGKNEYNTENRSKEENDEVHHKLETELDLNTNVENHCTTRPKHFDLNGFSWNQDS